MEPVAEIGVPLFTHLATATGLRRVNSHASSRWQWLKVAVMGISADCFNHRRKFMAENNRMFWNHFTNAAINIVV